MALLNCPECGRLVSDRASTCPSCGYLFKPPAHVPPSPTPHVQTVAEDDEDPYVPKIGVAQYAVGILLNLFIGGTGWLFAPAGHKWIGLPLFGLYLIAGFGDHSSLASADGLNADEVRLLLTALVNLFLTVIFAAQFRKHLR